MTWRVARSLDTLLDEIDAVAPNRSKVSDGSIGDAAHAARTSDHNPWVRDKYGVGVVRARDFTHDPAGGLSCQVLAVWLAGMLGRHPALGEGAYIIWNRQVISTKNLALGWRTYTGSNPHDKHLHLSVALDESGFDSTAPWGAMEPKEEEMTEDDRQALADEVASKVVEKLLAANLGKRRTLRGALNAAYDAKGLLKRKGSGASA